MNLLIVDDNPVALEVLNATLARSGHTVQRAAGGREALAVLREGVYRVVIADWEMPEMDGLALCRAIRTGGLPGYVYVILLTARDGRADRIEGLSAGADDFLTKPFDAAELLIRLHGADRLLALETRELTIFAMAKLAEARDPETGAHLERVRNYTRTLAAELQRQAGAPAEVTAEFVQMIYLTSPLHDIGKVAIPDRILLKPGRLNDREFAIMKEHAAFGAGTLRSALDKHPNAGFLKMAWQIALTHHERFDGSGYPAGLKGEEIPLCGRIMAVADVYDALISKRVYKAAMLHEVAASIILEESGSHFDPMVVAAFDRVQGEFARIHAAYAETDPSREAQAA